MSISTKDFVTLVRDSVTAIQGSASGMVNLTVGSILRAVVEANATVILWLQGLILQLLAATRAATSNDADLDSWMADFGVVRLGAVPASGLVAFSRFTPTAQAVVPVGATVLTLDGAQAYVALLDTTNAAYSALLGGYVLAPGVASINVTVTASTPGAAANAVAGQIALINQPIPGVDAVTNVAGFTNGVNAEKNAALRARFITYIASLSKATKLAIGNAVTSLAQGVTYSLTENFTYGGVPQNGYFFAVVDDGTGYPPSQLLSSAANAIDAVRPFTSTFGVFAPIVVTANISMTITTAAGYDHTATAAIVAAALRTYVNSLTLGQKLAFSRMTQIAYDASPGVTNVTAVMLNAGTADLAATALQVIKTGTVSVA
ncbi:baseplate protein [Janthinobacterium sp. BJB303]|nr:baseplate protein [Janthinobacterium sp. BJB303]